MTIISFMLLNTHAFGHFLDFSLDLRHCQLRVLVLQSAYQICSPLSKLSFLNTQLAVSLKVSYESRSG